LIPAVQAAREASRRSACGNNLKQLGQALNNYADTRAKDNENFFPPAYIKTGSSANPTNSWVNLVLPFIEESLAVNTGTTSRLDLSVCPGFSGTASVVLSYVGNVGTGMIGTTGYTDDGGMTYWSTDEYGLGTAAFNRTGLSKVIMLGEIGNVDPNTGTTVSSQVCSNWKPGTLATEKCHVFGTGTSGRYGSPHNGGLVGVCMADGATMFLVGTGTTGNEITSTNIKRY
jgi:hypothetical protein